MLYLRRHLFPLVFALMVTLLTLAWSAAPAQARTLDEEVICIVVQGKTLICIG